MNKSLLAWNFFDIVNICLFKKRESTHSISFVFITDKNLLRSLTFDFCFSVLFLQTIQTIDAVNTPNATEISSNEKTRLKRMYALCPPKFQRIGNECYFISHYKKSWLDAHFECKDRHSKLAEPLKYEDRRIRKYLLSFDRDHADKWIGATFNWEKNRWQWGYSGRNLQYQAFSRMNPG